MAIAEASTQPLVDHQPLLSAVDLRLGELFDEECDRWTAIDGSIAEGLTQLKNFVLCGGKRLRPQFVDLGYMASVDVYAPRLTKDLVDLAAAIELLHAFALVHDDVMDGSETRRHHPTIHAAYREKHRSLGWQGEARRTGEGMAILLGDLAFAYSIQLEHGMPKAVRSLMDTTRIELHMGQYLDMAAAAHANADHGRLVAITEYKTARYTVIRPLQLGDALTGSSTLQNLFSDYGHNVGIAFQLRDDLLGVFGDPQVTGKPLYDDLLSAKETLLLRMTTDHPKAAKLPALARMGTDAFSPDDAATVAEFMIDCGAVGRVEQRIDELTRNAIDLVDSADLRPDVAGSLSMMALRAGKRSQ